MKHFISLSLFLLCFSFVRSQQFIPCATDELRAEQIKANPQLAMLENIYNNNIRNTPALQKANTVKYIPVVFHVIHKYGFENVSQAQINDAIRVMNEDYRKMANTNGGVSTNPLATDMYYEFRLAQVDPNGNPTSGVTRDYSNLTDNAYESTKAINYWDAKKYFNIWVVTSINVPGTGTGTVLGYAQFPYLLNSSASTDGILVRSDQLGNIETAMTSQAGRTLTHESGHWTGLYHPFQDGCVGGTASTCNSQGDQVCDTPPVNAANYGCPSNVNSCTNDVPDLPDLYQDYMDYADGTCMNLFTPGQKARSDANMSQYRSQIYSSANLSLAGLNADGTYKTLTASTKKGPYSFGFDANNLSTSGWSLENYMSVGDSAWGQTTATAFKGTGCMKNRNLLNNRLNVRNAFTSPSIDISGMTAPTLTFYVAHAKKIAASADKLRIFISNNFGRTDSLFQTLLVSDFTSGTVTTADYTPIASDWKKITFSLAGFKNYTNCRIRFELQSLKGNNIYIDEFSITEPTGVSEQLKASLDFHFFPNPTSETATIQFRNTQKQDVGVKLYSLDGKLVQPAIKQVTSEGVTEIPVDLSGLQPGIYLLEVETNEGILLHKVVKK